MATTLGTLSALIEAELHGDPRVVVRDAQSLESAGEHEISYLSDERHLKQAGACRAAALIVPRGLVPRVQSVSSAACLGVDDPLLAFVSALEHFRPPRREISPGISDRAEISPAAQIAPDAEIHPGAHIADGAVIGSRCRILPGAYVGAGCQLGADVTLYPHVVLYANTIVGDRVTIHANSVIGADGFGYRVRDGRHCKIPHFGNVQIEDDVEIGACTTIDRAMVGTTRIGEGSKLDNLVMIGHNCELGRHNILVSQVGLAGSVTTGDYVVCAGQVGIGDHVHLGTGAVFGAKAGVHKDMPGGQTYLGTPAEPEGDAIRNVMSLKKLPELRRTVRRLEQQVAALTAQRSDGSESPGSAAGGSASEPRAA